MKHVATNLCTGSRYSKGGAGIRKMTFDGAIDGARIRVLQIKFNPFITTKSTYDFKGDYHKFYDKTGSPYIAGHGSANGNQFLYLSNHFIFKATLSNGKIQEYDWEADKGSYSGEAALSQEGTRWRVVGSKTMTLNTVTWDLTDWMAKWP